MMLEKIRSFWQWTVKVIKLFLDCDCPMHAAGLTYFALLAMVPILCLLLYGAKVCGIDSYARSQINTKLDTMIVNIEHGQDDGLVRWFSSTKVMSEAEVEKKRIAALEFGQSARDVSNKLFDRIDQFDISTLGWIGFLFLLWTVISTLGTVEASFNRIWDHAPSRPIWRRSLMYLFIAVVLPAFIAVAASLPILNVIKNALCATLGASWWTRWASDGIIWLMDSRAIRMAFTFFFTALDFALLFKVMPNCRVPFSKAAVGGLCTAFFFGCWMRICAIAQIGIAKSSALYGSFAILPILLAWFYISWQIILLGSCIAKETSIGNGKEKS